METRVVNLRKEPFNVYIGRGSQFGNPYKIGEFGKDREAVIALFKAYFYEKLKHDYFRETVDKLRGKTLGCYCKPKDCHGDIIKEYLDGTGKNKTA